jgi:thioredoxin reductase (NADPH)
MLGVFVKSDLRSQFRKGFFSMTNECDLVIVGGGPSGLSGAINAASEGLKVCLIDGGASLGGQAKESNRIENYPMPEGFHNGVTGQRLIAGFVNQAMRFCTNIICPTKVHSMHLDGKNKVLVTDDFNEFVSPAVMLSLGLTYRKHGANGLARFMGRGVWYGLPNIKMNLSGCTVAVVGGANSAGQAVMKLAENKRTKVKMLVRKKLTDQMSQYLVDRITATENIEVIEGAEVTAVAGKTRLQVVEMKYNGVVKTLQLDCLFFFIGAVPQTVWVKQAGVELSKQNFINTGRDVQVDGSRLPFETSLPGVFAVGDVRQGSTKRIANAIGEGASGLAMVHAFLAA